MDYHQVIEQERLEQAEEDKLETLLERYRREADALTYIKLGDERLLLPLAHNDELQLKAAQEEKSKLLGEQKRLLIAAELRELRKTDAAYWKRFEAQQADLMMSEFVVDELREKRMEAIEQKLAESEALRSFLIEGMHRRRMQDEKTRSELAERKKAFIQQVNAFSDEPPISLHAGRKASLGGSTLVGPSQGKTPTPIHVQETSSLRLFYMQRRARDKHVARVHLDVDHDNDHHHNHHHWRPTPGIVEVGPPTESNGHSRLQAIFDVEAHVLMRHSREVEQEALKANPSSSSFLAQRGDSMERAHIEAKKRAEADDKGLYGHTEWEQTMRKHEATSLSAMGPSGMFGWVGGGSKQLAASQAAMEERQRIEVEHKLLKGDTLLPSAASVVSRVLCGAGSCTRGSSLDSWP